MSRKCENKACVQSQLAKNRETAREKEGGSLCIMLSSDGSLVICGEGCWVCPFSAMKGGSKRGRQAPLSSSD